MTDLPPDHQIGANDPPPEEQIFVDRLKGDIEDLLDEMADLELALRKVPEEVADETQQALVTKHVLALRALAHQLEDKRVEVKGPYLQRERWIDGLFNGYRAHLLTTAKTVEGRNTAFLQARQKRQQEEARAKAEAAAKVRREQEAAAAAAREEQRQAERARVAAEEAVRRAARESEEAAAQAEANLRQAAKNEQAASKAAQTADKGVRTAGLAEERAERRADNPEALGKAGGGGGNAKVVMVPRYRIDNFGRLMASTGPLGTYGDMKWLEGPLQRWANIAQGDPKIRGDIPGVDYFEEPETKTTATRK
jgi:pyruvate/2-oxoglutarate dehydrogenase complex dihydrolipoamide acyltransferase (E2) component